MPTPDRDRSPDRWPEDWDEVARRTRGIFSDIDDTLTDGGHLVPAAYDALCRAKRAGLRVVLVTGRPVAWADVLASIFPVDAAVAENGAVASLPRGRRMYFEDDAARKVGGERRIRALTRARTEVSEAPLASDQPQREIDLAFDIAEHARLPEPTIARLVDLLQSEGLHTIRSSIHLHGTFSRADKASMSARVAAHLWGEDEASLRDDYLFVGDSPNDAPAFAFFRRSVGVANVREHEASLRAKNAWPWAITQAKGGHGFAEVVERLLRPPM